MSTERRIKQKILRLNAIAEQRKVLLDKLWASVEPTDQVTRGAIDQLHTLEVETEKLRAELLKLLEQ